MGQLINNADAEEYMYTPLMFFPNCVMIRMMYWIAFAAGRGEEMTLENIGTFGRGVMPCLLLQLTTQALFLNIRKKIGDYLTTC